MHTILDLLRDALPEIVAGLVIALIVALVSYAWSRSPAVAIFIAVATTVIVIALVVFLEHRKDSPKGRSQVTTQAIPSLGTGIKRSQKVSNGKTLGQAITLETPTGAVPLNSSFYVKRETDALLERQLSTPGSITTIRGARQMGKTSLLVRGVDLAKTQGALVIFLDCQQILSQHELTDMDQCFKHLACAIADEMEGDDAAIESVWKRPSSPKHKLTLFIEESILSKVKDSVLLAIDEADILLKAPFYDEFFSLLRAWHNRRVVDEQWAKLSIIMAISQHPSLLIDDVAQSPFNVGLTIKLDDFSKREVDVLNRKHGTPLASQEIPDVMKLLGGHPYLIRQALFTLVQDFKNWIDLVAVADRENGPFGNHLRYYLNLLHSDDELMTAMRGIVTAETCPEHRIFLRLESAGLVKQQDGKCVCRYGLYQRFFRSQLS